MSTHSTPSHDASSGAAHVGAHPTPFARLVRLLSAERTELGSVLIYAIGVGLVSLATPIAVAALVNTITFGMVLQPIVVLAFLVFLGLCFEGTMDLFQLWLVELIQRRVFVRVATDLAHRLPAVRLDAVDGTNRPELVNRFFDVLTVQKTAATLLLDGLGIVLQTAIGLLLLAFYHPILLAFDVVLVGAIAVVLFPLGSGAVASSIKESKAKYAVAAWLEELAQHPMAFRGTGAQRFAATRVETLTRGYLTARGKHFRIVLRQHVGTRAFKAFISAGLLGLGGWLVINRGLTVGQLVAAELIVSAVVSGMAKFGKQLDAYYDLVTAADKLGHLLDLPPERAHGYPLPPRQLHGAQLRVEGVYFAFDPARPVVDGLSLTVEPGGRVAVLGANSSGKSTVAEILYGLRTPTRGTVTIDGANLRELSLASLRHEVSLVGRPEVFDGTVADNVSLQRDDVCADDVREALRRAGLADDIAALPEGMFTPLVSGGAPLSQTQSVRLSLARAMASRPRLLVVDGSLDGVEDSVAEELLRALSHPEAPWTLVLLTHRPPLAQMLPKRYVLSRDAATPAGPVSLNPEAAR